MPVKSFQDRKLAILITILVTVLATSLGVYKTSAIYTKKVEAGFYDGVAPKGEGFTQPGINYYLNNCANEALNLATVMAGYPELSEKSEALLSARRELLTDGSIAYKQAAFRLMDSCFGGLADAAKGAALSDVDAKALSDYVSNYRGAVTVISSSAYNGTVTEYLDGRSPLMQSFSGLIPMKEPAYFTLSE